MTLGSRLRRYLPDGVEQKVVAMNWIAGIEAAGLKGLSPSTVTSRLSELFADEAQGIRTFFRDPRRATALFDVLGVPEGARAELRTLAEPVLAGVPQPRLVVDVSDLGAERARMDGVFARLRDAVFGEDGIFPVALVLTHEQYDLLPRSFDRFKEQMQLERVVDAAAGGEAATRLAGPALSLLSQRPLVELPRWWAMSVERGALALEPVDGLERIRSVGRIGTPVVAHVLGEGPPLRGRPQIPPGGVARRRLVAELADEASKVSAGDSAWRRAAAQELGVGATSTERERIEAEIAGITAKLGIAVRKATAAEWDAAVARAARRPADATAMRVGDFVRVLNPADAVVPAGRLEVARVACAEPALVTLERALAACTEDHLLDDPLLGGLIHRLAGKDEQALKLLFHARAVLVLGGRIRPKDTVAVSDPLAALAHLLAGEVPAALLRVGVSAETLTYGSAQCNVRLRPFVYPDGRMYYAAAQGSLLLHSVPPLGDVLFARGATLQGVCPATGRESAGFDGWRDSAWNHAGKPSAVVNPRADVGAWLDDVEASPLFGGSSPEHRWSSTQHLPEPKAGHDWTKIPEPADLWLDADTNLALAWLALRQALGSPCSIRLPGGSVLLRVGGGLAARVRVRRYGGKKAEVRAAVRCDVKPNNHGGAWAFGDLAMPVTTHVAHTDAYTTRLSMLMPAIWLAGQGFAADVSFVAAPMLLGGPLVADGLASATAGAVAAIDEARKRAIQAMYDEYDD